ncbi:MAG TPA: MarR family transcriptional regulator [Candidatus Saccharimonadales bacterium]|nr:MarR family transcriptional regulator [Candidatus Saccharimonadales bacterium]
MQSDIGSLLHRVSAALDKISDQVLLERLGIGLSQFRILLCLLGSDGIRQNVISESLDQSEPSVSRQVKILQQKGLAVVRRNVSNRRDRLIFLTQKGAKTAERAVEILNEYHSPMFERISQKDQEQLITTLKNINDYLDD